MCAEPFSSQASAAQFLVRERDVTTHLLSYFKTIKTDEKAVAHTHTQGILAALALLACVLHTGAVALSADLLAQVWGECVSAGEGEAMFAWLQQCVSPPKGTVTRIAPGAVDMVRHLACVSLCVLYMMCASVVAVAVSGEVMLVCVSLLRYCSGV